MKITPVLAFVAVAVVMSACGGSSQTGSASSDSKGGSANGEGTPCERAFAAAAEVSDFQDTLSDMYPAFTACADLAEFSAASAKYPDALDGTDPAVYVSNGCQFQAEVKDSGLCAASE